HILNLEEIEGLQRTPAVRTEQHDHPTAHQHVNDVAESLRGTEAEIAEEARAVRPAIALAIIEARIFCDQLVVAEGNSLGNGRASGRQNDAAEFVAHWIEQPRADHRASVAVGPLGFGTND